MMATQMPAHRPSTEDQTEQTKSRIITHMNRDHQDSLVRFLEHYSHVPSYTARHAYLVDISLAWLHISTSKQPPSTSSKHDSANTYRIPLDPPLSSYSEFRQRLVDLDKECTTALGRSPITVKRWTPPHGYRIMLAVGVIFAFTLLSTAANVDPRRNGWLLSRSFKSNYLPSFFTWLQGVRLWILVPTFVAHAGEAILMDQLLLQKHSVPRLSPLWWKWVSSTFLDGFGNFIDFNKMVNEEKQRKEKAKH